MKKVVSNEQRLANRCHPSRLRGFVPTCLGYSFDNRQFPPAFSLHFAVCVKCHILTLTEKMYLQNEPI